MDNTDESGSTQSYIEKSPAGPVGRLIIVDDDVTIRQVLARSLKDCVSTVDQASCGAMAIRMIQHSNYDCILLDLKMPGVGGLEVFENIASQDSKVADRIVFMTGDPLSDQAALISSHLSNHLVIKPFDMGCLKRIVGSVVVEAHSGD